MINASRALSGRMNLFGVNTQGIVLMHEALGFALATFQAADWAANEWLDRAPNQRLEKPPESSPGLSGAMPWVNVPPIISRPEGAQEA
jgi:hypothetical protein